MKSITDLIERINKATKAYDEGNPIMSDKEWDNLYFELVELEKETGIIYPNSPTQIIDYQVENELRKAAHTHPMLSADKTKDWNKFVDYFGDKDVIGMLKMDGLTCSLRYVDGELVSAETRGNGIIGEDVTHNAKVISNIPKYIPYDKELIVDGEIICTEDNFKPFADSYKNPRNFASGSIRLLDANECAKRNLSFILWNIVKGFDKDDRFLDKLNKAENLGFEVVPYTSSFDWDAKEYLVNRAKEFGYPIDGLVGRFDDIEYGESLGVTQHHTKAIYAFKFYDEEYETKLINIDWSMSRNGILTPVAVFEPVDDGDSVIERASLHNISMMYETLNGGAYVGETISVAKMNQIIPQIVKAETTGPKNGEELIPIPDICPVCGGVTHIEISESGTKNLICGNPQCQGKLQMRIDHYCSKKGLDIKGISEQIIEKLISWGWLDSIKDIYFLKNHKSEWINKSGFGEKSVNKILAAIEDSKNCELYKFISALGIPLVGNTIAKEICKYYFTWSDFKDAIGGNWSSFDGFGIEIEKAINNFDYAEADEIAEMLTFKQIEVSRKEELNAIAAGLTFVITGKLSKPRSAIQSDIESAGSKVGSSVSSKTNYLVCNQKENTTKYNKAISLGIPIITEDELYQLLKN